MIKKAILLFCVLHLSHMIFVDKMQLEGVLLAKLKNLPHRSLGMLYWCHIQQPHRVDYARDYLVQYYTYMSDNALLEGQKIPVVDCYTMALARQFPNSNEMQLIRDIVMNNHFERLAQVKPKEHEIELKPDLDIGDGWVREN